MTFSSDGSFTAHVAGQYLMGGKFNLLSAGEIIMEPDSSSPAAGTALTNTASLVRGELRLTPRGGKTERYRRSE